jgi:hypothetical protein
VPSLYFRQTRTLVHFMMERDNTTWYVGSDRHIKGFLVLQAMKFLYCREWIKRVELTLYSLELTLFSYL